MKREINESKGFYQVVTTYCTSDIVSAILYSPDLGERIHEDDMSHIKNSICRWNGHIFTMKPLTLAGVYAVVNELREMDFTIELRIK